MAATAVSVRISPASGSSLQGRYFLLSNSNASSATFLLKAGKYFIEVIGSTFGTVTLQKLAPDGSTFLAAVTAFSANGTASADLPSGTYKIALA